MPDPLVTVGMPIRNGMPLLPEALASVTGQSYGNLEIVISDNGSSDGSWEYCCKVAAGDPRIQLFRQVPELTAWQNFRYVLQAARGDLFAWAAHDDWRSPNYVSELAAAIQAKPGAVLAYSNLVQVEGVSGDEKSFPQESVFDIQNLSTLKRLRLLAPAHCAETYGLFRRAELQTYPWLDIDFAPDVPLLIYMSLRGDIVKARDATFYQRMGASPKSAKARALANSYKDDVAPLRVIRLSWASATNATQAVEGGVRFRVCVFLNIYYSLRYSLTKTQLFEASPPFLQQLWRNIMG